GLAVVFVHTLDGARLVEKWNREYITWHGGQLEADFWQLVDSVDRFAAGDPEVDRAAVEQRFDVVVSRVAIFDAGLGRERPRRADGGPALSDTGWRLVTAAEARIESLAPGDRAGLAAARADLATLAPRLKDLTIKFEHFETNGAIAAVQSLRGYF